MMREWYSGSTSPCQGEDRGFDPRLALILFAEVLDIFQYFLFLTFTFYTDIIQIMKTKILIYIIAAVIICGLILTGINFYKNVLDSPAEVGVDSDTSKINGNKDTEFGDFTVSSLDGSEVTSEILKGHKVNLINIWATYCGPCITEMPDLDIIDKKYGDEVQVIGICIDIADINGNVDAGLLEQALKIANDVTQVSYMSLIPSPALLKGVLSDVFAVPTSYIVDENGKVLESFVGRKSQDELEKLLKKYL